MLALTLWPRYDTRCTEESTPPSIRMYPIIRKLEIEGSIPTCISDGDQINVFYSDNKNCDWYVFLGNVFKTDSYHRTHQVTPRNTHPGYDTRCTTESTPRLSLPKTGISGVEPKCATQMVSIPSVSIPPYLFIVLVSQRLGSNWHGTFGIKQKVAVAAKLQTRSHLHAKPTSQ